MKKLILILMCLLIPILCFAETDIKGWQNAQWGMTDEQVLQALQSKGATRSKREEYNSGHYTKILIDSYSISGDKYEVRFLMSNDTDRLSKVILSPKETPSLSLFRKLEKNLTEKYGKPSYEKNDSKKYQTMWNLPSTTIELSYTEIRSSYAPPLIFLHLSYKESNPEDLDSL